MSLQTSVVITEEYNVLVHSVDLIGTVEFLRFVDRASRRNSS